MRYFAIGDYLPYAISKHLFGDRKRFGLEVREDDPDWQEWLKTYILFYEATQKQSVGKIANDAGYRVMDWIDLSQKTILEIGPGNINHLVEWRGKPEQYVLVDISADLLSKSAEKLMAADVSHDEILVSRSNEGHLPFKDESFDAIISFYTLEHLHPFHQHLDAMLRVLKKGGIFIGGIPTEGGIGWGLGRYITSRQWFLKNTIINPDKIICWEHPNFASKILQMLDQHQHLERQRLAMWPLGGPIIDFNLIVKFLYRKIS